MLMFSLVAVVLAAEPTPTATPLYSPAEAIADALSGPLVRMVGDTGSAPNERLPDCFYRNERVIVLNRYCSKREINTTGIQLMHPERGVIDFYAEASAPDARQVRGEDAGLRGLVAGRVSPPFSRRRPRAGTRS